MRILHLSIYDRKGGACIAAYRQHQALVAAGIDSSMWVRQKFTDDLRVSEFCTPSDLVSRARRAARRQWLRRERRLAAPHGEIFDDRSEHDGSVIQELPPHDLINIQFSQGFIDLPILYRSIPASLPVVVSLHEMSMFTGGCSYSYACRNFEHECGNCPLLGRRCARDITHQSLLRKQMAYSLRPEGMLRFVANSHWISAEAHKSTLLKNYPIQVIHLPVDTDVFQPRLQQSPRDVLGLPQGIPIIAFAAASVSDERKGVSLLAEAIRTLPQKPFLLTWGGSFPKALADLPHLHLGPIDSEHLVSIAYNAADFFVIPSQEEAFGQTCLESMSCGRPVIGFDVGGIPDMILHNETGLLVPKGDVPALAQAIQRLIDDTQQTETMGRKARQMVMDQFTFAHNAEAYRKLYGEMLKR